jgi:hypothetical protein
MYDAMFKLWADTFVPRLIYRPSKWNQDDEELHIGDLVYFQKSPDKKLGSKWIIGMVEQLPRGRDGKVRRALVKFQNAKETQPRVTDRAVRSLVKIYDIDEYILQEDLQEVLQRIRDDEQNDVNFVFPEAQYSAEMTAPAGKTAPAKMTAPDEMTASDEVTDYDCPQDQDSPQVYSQSQVLLSNSLLTVSGLWLQRPVCQVYQSKYTQEEFMEKWADRCQMTYAECSLLSQATATNVASSFGDPVDNTMPSMRFLSAHFVDAVQPDAKFSDSDPLGLIQMIKRTDLSP